jgi:hypothetical protein
LTGGRNIAPTRSYERPACPLCAVTKRCILWLTALRICIINPISLAHRGASPETIPQAEQGGGVPAAAARNRAAGVRAPAGQAPWQDERGRRPPTPRLWRACPPKLQRRRAPGSKQAPRLERQEAVVPGRRVRPAPRKRPPCDAIRMGFYPGCASWRSIRPSRGWRQGQSSGATRRENEFGC